VLAKVRHAQQLAVHRYNQRHLDACGPNAVVAARIVKNAPGAYVGVGAGSHVRGRLITWLPDSRLTIGGNCIVNARCVIESFGSVTVGDDTLFGFDVLVGDGRGHSIDWADRVEDAEIYRNPGTVNTRTLAHDPIAIGDGCWIGARAIILPGVTIGEGVTIGAASVVTKSIPPFSVAAGNPARVVKELEHRRPPGR
jgi:acetyltransferase-like isoleucine patch superfamily enzyme